MSPALKSPKDLNCNDLPEASLVGGSGPLSRRLGHRDDRAKFRVKSLVLPTLSEDLAEDDDQSCSRTPSEQPLSSWSCPACTFANLGPVVKCEICGTLFNSTAAVIDASAASMVDKDGEDLSATESNWPSLHEAVYSFVDCEISSVGSSWQDIGDVVDFEDDDDDIVIVNASAELSVPLSWAARAKAISGSGPAISIPMAGVATPPLKRTQLSKADMPMENELQSNTNWELDCLEDRRICTRGQRKHCGSGRRLRRTRH